MHRNSVDYDTIFFVVIPLPPRLILFPYTTLFRSDQGARFVLGCFCSVSCVGSYPHVDAWHEIGRAHAELQSQFHLVCRLLLEKKNKSSFRRRSAASQFCSRGDSGSTSRECQVCAI